MRVPVAMRRNIKKEDPENAGPAVKIEPDEPLEHAKVEDEGSEERKAEKIASEALVSASTGAPASGTSPGPPPKPAVAPQAAPPASGAPRPPFVAPAGPLPRPPFPAAGAPRPPGMPAMALPPGLAPALRGASPAQIAEMIAAARQIQQQRLLQQQSGNAAGTAAGTVPGANTQTSLAAGPGAAPGAVNPSGSTLARPVVVMSRPAGTGAAGGVPLAQQPPSSSQQQQLQGISLKRKLDAATANIAMGGTLGTESGLPAAQGYPAMQHQPGGGGGGPSEEVATSADEPVAPGVVGIGVPPATSVSAHYMYGNSGEMYGDDDGSGESGAGADGKKVRLVWTQELHNRFINALSQLGLKHAVPKNILTLMNVDGMTRENVASHLQKYRLYLKKIGGHSDKERVDPEVLQTLHERNVQHMAAQQAMQHSMAAVTGGGFMGGAMHHHHHHQQQHHFPSNAAAAPFGAYPPSSGAMAGGAVAGAPASHSYQPSIATVTGTPHNALGAGNPAPGPEGDAEGGGGSDRGGAPAPGPDDIVEGIPISDVPVPLDHPVGTVAGVSVGCTTAPPPRPLSPSVTAAVATGGRFNLQGWQYPPLPLPGDPRGDPSTLQEPSLAFDNRHQSGTGGPSSGAALGHVLGMPPGSGAMDAAGLAVGVQYFPSRHHHGTAIGIGMHGMHHHHDHPDHQLAWDDTDAVEGWEERWPEDAEHGDTREGKKDGAGGGNGGNGGGEDDDGDGEDPPLIPAVPSAGNLHHAVVERLPMSMPMADTV